MVYRVKGRKRENCIWHTGEGTFNEKGVCRHPKGQGIKRCNGVVVEKSFTYECPNLFEEDSLSYLSFPKEKFAALMGKAKTGKDKIVVRDPALAARMVES